MIRAFSSDERTFFIENMIGDLFTLNMNVQNVLCEELSFKPYAGMFIVYMIDRFEMLSEEEFKLWDACTNNVYLQELKVLTKSNQSRFSKFILDYMVKRRDDKVKQEAMKFIERLKELPEYEPIIEEGVEEAIKNGDEEVKFLKKDMVECKVPYIQDMVKFTITGNIKQIEKLVEEHKLTAVDIYDVRGFAVKAYDPDHAIINTREWNPVVYAIFFRQIKVLQYFINELKVNLKLALEYSHTYNEFIDDPSYHELIGNQRHLYGLLMSIWSRDMQILKYLYEDCADKLQISEYDLMKLLKLAI
jgi:hypothetical protein